ASIAAASRSQSPREIDDRLSVSKTVPREAGGQHLERGRFRPATPLEGIARGDGGERVSHLEYLLVHLGYGRSFFYDAFGLAVATTLQVSVYQIVHGMELILGGGVTLGG